MEDIWYQVEAELKAEHVPVSVCKALRWLHQRIAAYEQVDEDMSQALGRQEPLLTAEPFTTNQTQRIIDFAEG